jgi:predicted ATPase
LLGSPEIAARFQIIVATHSPFALMVPHAHIVEMSDGFVAETRKAIKHLAA